MTADGIDPSRIHGTGHGGRVTRDDLLGQPAEAVEPFSALRRTTARRLVEAKTTAAHTHVMVECDYRGVDRVRRPARLSYLPFVARAVIDALREFPICNATVSGEEITAHAAVHLGIAVDLDHVDLVVPVVHDAHTLRLHALSSKIGDVARRARDRHLQPDDVTGGTFTITNPGPFGTIVSAPVLNLPQVAILATDAVRPRLVVVPGKDGSDAIAVHPVGVLSLGFDGRAVGLTTASAFLARVRDLLEQRDWATEV
jgi:2-oxoglutarate dehydrogenase E2 component (dihydrolipoamide succinyltransferase)